MRSRSSLPLRRLPRGRLRGFLRGSVMVLALLVVRPAAADLFLLGPPDADGPVAVSIGFFLSDVNSIDERLESFGFEAVLTLEWHDPRQAFDPEAVGSSTRVYQGDYQFNEQFDGWWPQLILTNESGAFDQQAVLLQIAADGTMLLLLEVSATAEMPMQLRRFPFDRQGFEARFAVFGFGSDRVVLVPDPSTSGSAEEGVRLAEWDFEGLELGTAAFRARYGKAAHGDGHHGEASEFVVTLDLARRPAHMLHVVMLPLTILVLLTFSVFWMDRESLGDRMDISFIGILTVVAYHIIVSDSMPRIAYFTLMSSFLFSTYIVLAIGVIVNLVVAKLDRAGHPERGDRVDRRCRWLLPLGFFGVNALSALFFFLRY